ncbi:MAG: protein-L-isoaspartate(D-aspartate) O-methyltransferase [Helicobacteraceae bacterium]|jgi:protein-L-isoaspartate(D-aspartate) O-methyltransferase|nr:protein-L-isoaspartate(D-aspartate) O-methyltransferase [Helicobacteraceae bacterium]
MPLNQAQAVFAAELAQKLALTRKTLNAFAEVDRSLFIPAGLERLTYSCDALPIGANQRLSSPLTVAKMTAALDADDADGVLEIGCGSGYQAAILSRVARRVFTVERIERLAIEAKARFRALNYFNVNVRFDDGHNGWKTYAPFDRILLSCETRTIAPPLLEQLAAGGVLVAPIDGQITRIVKRESGAIAKETLGDCSFVPMLGGVEKDRR